MYKLIILSEDIVRMRNDTGANARANTILLFGTGSPDSWRQNKKKKKKRILSYLAIGLRTKNGCEHAARRPPKSLGTVFD